MKIYRVLTAIILLSGSYSIANTCADLFFRRGSLFLSPGFSHFAGQTSTAQILEIRNRAKNLAAITLSAYEKRQLLAIANLTEEKRPQFVSVRGVSTILDLINGRTEAWTPMSVFDYPSLAAEHATLNEIEHILKDQNIIALNHTIYIYGKQSYRQYGLFFTVTEDGPVLDLVRWAR